MLLHPFITGRGHSVWALRYPVKFQGKFDYQWVVLNRNRGRNRNPIEVPIGSMGNGIFPYMNGWFLWFSCRYIYQSHGSYGVNSQCNWDPTFVLWTHAKSAPWQQWSLKVFGKLMVYLPIHVWFNGMVDIGKWSILTNGVGYNFQAIGCLQILQYLPPIQKSPLKARGYPK